jgi:hypothetical protein
VNAPFLCPNNSLSIRFSDIAPQFNAMKGLLALFELKCNAFATSSLPVPLFPEIKTVLSVSATAFIISKICPIAGLLPMMFV